MPSAPRRPVGTCAIWLNYVALPPGVVAIVYSLGNSQRVLINGAGGGIGMAVQIAKSFGEDVTGEYSMALDRDDPPIS